MYYECEGSVLKHRILSKEEEIELSRRARKGDVEARDELVMCNLRLARKFASYAMSAIEGAAGMDGDDLMSCAFLGLMEAAEKYDPELGYRFSTYATIRIKKCVFEEVRAIRDTIRRPAYIQEIISKLLSSGGKESVEKFAERNDYTVTSVQYAIASMDMSVFSISGLGESGSEHTVDLPTENSRESEIERTEMVESVLRNLDSHDQKLGEVARIRFGLEGRERKTLKETGKQFRVSRQAVQQTEARALGIARRALERSGLEVSCIE